MYFKSLLCLKSLFALVTLGWRIRIFFSFMDVLNMYVQLKLFFEFFFTNSTGYFYFWTQLFFFILLINSGMNILLFKAKQSFVLLKRRKLLQWIEIVQVRARKILERRSELNLWHHHQLQLIIWVVCFLINWKTWHFLFRQII